MYKKYLSLGLAGLALMSLFAAAVRAELVEGPPGFVKDSYIITFKPPGRGERPLVWPGKGKGARGKLKFMEHTSGQSKQALAAQLGLNGKIKSLIEAANAIHVRMSAEEAAKFRHDPRVLSVSQGKIVTSAGVLNGGVSTEDTSWWGLDRLDSPSPGDVKTTDSRYNEPGPDGNKRTDGTGRTIYIFDTGIAHDQPLVRAQFERADGTSRLRVWDITEDTTDPKYNLGVADMNGDGEVDIAVESVDYNAIDSETGRTIFEDLGEHGLDTHRSLIS